MYDGNIYDMAISATQLNITKPILKGVTFSKFEVNEDFLYGIDYSQSGRVYVYDLSQATPTSVRDFSTLGDFPNSILFPSK